MRRQLTAWLTVYVLRSRWKPPHLYMRQGNEPTMSSS
jgi:hypothetical protein